MALHPAIQEELDMLKERFPGKTEMSLDEYAEYFGISRGFAAQHFSRINEKPSKIAHKRIGRKVIIIPMLDFAYWLASQKVVDGKPLILPTPEQLRQDMKRRRGFSLEKNDGYRRLE